MLVIGLCGGSCSGKGTVASVFIKNGIPVIDADKVYMELTSYMSPCLIELKAYFGDQIISCGRLDKEKLRQHVFEAGKTKERLVALNEITHKYILANIREKLSEFEKNDYTVAVVDAPLLFESGFDKECDFIVSVIAEYGLRIQRIIQRDGISAEMAEKRVSSQISDCDLIANSDYVITNNTDYQDLENQVLEIINKIKNR